MRLAMVRAASTSLVKTKAARPKSESLAMSITSSMSFHGMTERTGPKISSRLVCQSFFAFEKITRSEEHTSELQSRFDLVCRLLLEKKKTSMYLQNADTHKS